MIRSHNATHTSSLTLLTNELFDSGVSHREHSKVTIRNTQLVVQSGNRNPSKQLGLQDIPTQDPGREEREKPTFSGGRGHTNKNTHNNDTKIRQGSRLTFCHSCLVHLTFFP